LAAFQVYIEYVIIVTRLRNEIGRAYLQRSGCSGTQEAMPSPQCVSVVSGNCMNGDPPRVFALLSPMINYCVEQLNSLSFAEEKQIVQSVPAGLRMMIEPISEPLTPEYIGRVAEYAIAVEVQKGYTDSRDKLA
jgi:hypothetical protein